MCISLTWFHESTTTFGVSHLPRDTQMSRAFEGHYAYKEKWCRLRRGRCDGFIGWTNSDSGDWKKVLHILFHRRICRSYGFGVFLSFIFPWKSGRSFLPVVALLFFFPSSMLHTFHLTIVCNQRLCCIVFFSRSIISTFDYIIALPFPTN